MSSHTADTAGGTRRGLRLGFPASIGLSDTGDFVLDFLRVLAAGTDRRRVLGAGEGVWALRTRPVAETADARIGPAPGKSPGGALAPWELTSENGGEPCHLDIGRAGG